MIYHACTLSCDYSSVANVPVEWTHLIDLSKPSDAGFGDNFVFLLTPFTHAHAGTAGGRHLLLHHADAEGCCALVAREAVPLAACLCRAVCAPVPHCVRPLAQWGHSPGGLQPGEAAASGV